MPDPLTLAILGANGAVGRHAVRQAVDRGHVVHALEPDWPAKPDLPPGVTAHTADVMNDDLAPLFRGCDAVLSCIGVGMTARNAFDPPPLYTKGTDGIIQGMKGAGIRRLIVISASFVVTLDRGPVAFRAAAAVALHRIFDEMGEMEHRLRAEADLDWTAVRPGWLMDGQTTADYVVRPETIPPDTIRTRQGDLAHFMLRCAETGDWIHRTPAIARVEADDDSGIAAVVRELAG